LDHIKYQLESQKPCPEDVERFAEELEVIKLKITSWIEVAPIIDGASQQSGTYIRDTATGKRVTAVALVHELQIKEDVLQAQLSNKREVLEEVSAHWSEFQRVQQSLSEGLLAMQGTLQETIMEVDSCDKLEQAGKNVAGLLEEHKLKEGTKDELHRQGKLLMEEDQRNMSTIQTILASLDANWEKVSEMLKEQKVKYVEMSTAWKNFCDAKEKVYCGISEAEKLCQSVQEVPSDLTQVTLTHDKTKKALEVLKKAKVSLDVGDSKGQILLKLAEPISGFKSAVIGEELSQVRNAWQHAYDTVAEKVQMLEAQLIIWKQIDEAKNEVLRWLRETSDALSDAALNLSDIESGQCKLSRYKDELPAHYNLKTSVISKTTQLVKLNDGKQIQTLESLNKLLEDEFAHVKGIADKLEDITCMVGEQESSVRDELKKASVTITKIREAVIKCDDLTGENAKILERLKNCQALKCELQSFCCNLDLLKEKIEGIKSNYPAFGDSGLTKELVGLQKRYDGVSSHANKTELTLLTFLNRYYMEKFSALQRGVVAHKEKVTWCLPEAGSDKYNLEVKISSLRDVEGGLLDCETKKADLDMSLVLLQNVETPEKMKELQTERDQLITELESLKNSYLNTKQLLEHNINLWQRYEIESENVASWLKETEGKVRSESVIQLNLSTIGDKIKEMESFHKQVKDFETEIRALSLLGEEIMKKNPESRVGQYVAHLVTRYQGVVKFAATHIERLTSLNKAKYMYETSVADAENWLAEAGGKLKSFEGILSGGAKPMHVYQSKLEELKAFAEEREKGQALLNKAVETGETLFSGITPENRETVRSELRKLRDAFESLIDEANALHKRVEGFMLQRSSFEDSYGQVSKWLTESENKIGSKMDLKATLKDKKIAMHGYKTLAQDVNTHKNIMKQLQEKLGALSDSEATTKFNNILTSYEMLSKNVEERIVVAERHVFDHEMYLQVLEKSRDWLSTLSAEAAVVTDETALEKESADAKLSIIENLLHHKVEGDQLIETCHKQLQTVLEQTNISGHPSLLQEFEDQKKAWEAFLARCTDAQTKLCQLCSRWSEFEETVEVLTSWTKQKESQVKDQSLRSTQEAKKAHLDKLRSTEEEISAKGEEFSRASEQSQTIDGESELSLKVSHLITRYQALKNLTRVRDFVNRHKNKCFETNNQRVRKQYVK
jgi:nesprin-1